MDKLKSHNNDKLMYYSGVRFSFTIYSDYYNRNRVHSMQVVIRALRELISDLTDELYLYETVIKLKLGGDAAVDGKV